MLRPVNHCDDIYLIGFDVINNTIRALKDFTYLWKVGFRNGAAGLGEVADLLRSSGQTINDSLSVLRRALLDVGMKSLDVTYRGVGPVNPHFGRPNEERTCSTSVVRPVLLSANPASMA